MNNKPFSCLQYVCYTSLTAKCATPVIDFLTGAEQMFIRNNTELTTTTKMQAKSINLTYCLFLSLQYLHLR